jgi:hypothetical protein
MLVDGASTAVILGGALTDDAICIGSKKYFWSPVSLPRIKFPISHANSQPRIKLIMSHGKDIQKTLEVKIRPFQNSAQERADQKGISRVYLSKEALFDLKLASLVFSGESERMRTKKGRQSPGLPPRSPLVKRPRR